MKVTDSGLRCLRFSCFALGLLTAWLTTGLCIAVDADHAQRMREGLALFDSTIAPLLKENCVNCHGGQNVKGDLDFATRAGLLKGGSHGQTIIPGDGAGSFMYQVTARLEEPFMPSKGDPLGPKQVEALKRWIDLGAPYSKPLVDDPREVVDLSVVTDEDRQFWSFRPLQTDFGGRNSVDQFITRKLEEQGLSLSPVADRRTLITRVSLDLTGLPPTPEEVDAFLADASPDAWEKVIGRLLDSPHYGERWARHWMDLARYADSGGFENDNNRHHAWPYRDFLIRAFNQNMPYDQFVHWQLAGDEIAPDDHLAWQATGFLAAGVKNGQITEREAELERYDVIDDWVNTTGNAFLGLSLGCARCHDHKFDPIPAADYYSLASIFATTTRRYENIHLPQTAEDRARSDAHEKAIANAKAKLEQYEKQLLLKKDRSEAAADPAGWVYLPTESFVGLSSPPENNANELHRTTMKVEEVAPHTFQATYVNGGHAGYVLNFRTSLAGIRGVSIEMLPDLENPTGGIGTSMIGRINLSKVTVTATPFTDDKPGKSIPVKFNVTDTTDGDQAQQAKRLYGIEKGTARNTIFGGVEPQALFLGWDQLPTADEYRFSVRLPCANDTPEGRFGLGKVRLKFLLGTEKRPLLEPAVDGKWLVEATNTPSPSKQATLAALAIADPEWIKLARQVQDLTDQLPPAPFQTALVTTEGKTPAHWKTQSVDFWEDVYLLRRGSPANKERKAEPGFLQVVALNDGEQEFSSWEQAVANPITSGRRTALASWLTDAEKGAGRLAARVMVNRLWQHHFAKGIVSTPSDFGAQGTPPTHPELLDWLAQQFIDSGWDLKAMHRLILTSATWRQSSALREDAAEPDPHNHWLWRYPPHRLEAEVIRDRMLAVSGLLDRTMYGKGTLDEAMFRRSIYFEIKRSQLIPMMVQLNWPDTLASLDQRAVTTVAPQALLMMNNPQVRKYSETFAKHLGSQSSGFGEQIESAYQRALGRPPTESERSAARAFLTSSGSQPPKERLADFCQTLFSLNEFVYQQ